MLGLARKTENSAAIRRDVATYMYDVFTTDDSTLSGMDRWTQRRVMEENMAKLALVLEADDPVEHCYQNLIREIDSEAETGIYLARKDASSQELAELADDPGISGELYQHLERIAKTMFADELAHSDRDLDLVWVTIQARYDRAKIDATISQMIMAHLTEADAGTPGMSTALRTLWYSFHENVARRLTGLPTHLNDLSSRELMLMVSELAERAGDYAPRVDEISDRACGL